MGEAEIKRGVAFMNNPRLTTWTQQQKIEFLRGKMSPPDLEEVIKRTSSGKVTDDVTQFFEMEASQPAAPPTKRVEIEPKKAGYGMYALVSAGLIGALTSALFFSGPSPKPKQKPDVVPPPLSRHNTEPPLPAPFEEVKVQPPAVVEEVKEKQQRLETSLFAIEAKLKAMEEVPAKPVPVLPPPQDFYSLHRAIAGYITTCSQELKGKVLASLVMWLQKIEGNPTDKAITRINVSTPKFKNEVATVVGVENLMMALGFTLNGSFWEFSDAKLAALREGLRILTEENLRARTSTQAVLDPKHSTSLPADLPPVVVASEEEDSKADASIL